MKINGIELQDIDMMDCDVMEKAENAIEGIKNISKECEGLKTSEAMRLQCNAVFKVFNDLFGNGTDKKVFGEKTNLLVCLKAFEELVLKLNEKNAEIEKLKNKYSPNRAARRSKK